MLKCVTEYDLDLCGDSVEWCPKVGYRHLLMCGSYQLQPDSSHRAGRIDLFHYEDSKLIHRQGIQLNAGLLDAKWAPNTPNDVILLAAALSDGSLNIYKLVDNELILVSSSEICSNGMALAVDWSTGVLADSQPRLVVSQSNGCVSIIQMNQDGSLIVTNEFKAHSYEAWIAAFNYWNTNIIYSGGDDCKLNTYDIRKSTTRPIDTDTSHSVGVTSLQCNQKFEGYFASASYENVRIWKTTNGLLECLDSEEMKGGSWRVKWNVSGNCGKLAVAGMHEGFTIIDYSVDDPTPNTNETVETPNGTSISFLHQTGTDCSKRRIDYRGCHSSLGYGIDWCYNDSNIISACSFYDKKLSIAQLTT